MIKFDRRKRLPVIHAGVVLGVHARRHRRRPAPGRLAGCLQSGPRYTLRATVDKLGDPSFIPQHVPVAKTADRRIVHSKSITGLHLATGPCHSLPARTSGKNRSPN